MIKVPVAMMENVYAMKDTTKATAPVNWCFLDC